MSAEERLGRLKDIWNTASGPARDALMEDALFEDERDRFWLILGGHLFFQTLRAATRLELFTHLAERPGLTRPQIAELLGLEEKPARILLLGCTALGLVRKQGAGYANAPLAQLLLVRGGPKSIRSLIELEHHVIYRPMQSFLEALKENRNVGLREYKGNEPTLYQRLAHHPELEKIFQDAMEDISVQANAAFAQFVDLSRVRRLVDVGGGNGANIITLARKYPQMRATVFDSPTVCEIARANIKAAGLADRLDAVPGNAFADKFPAGADAILFAHFFTIWSEEKDRLLLKKAFDALPPGGSVLLFNMMQADTEDGPLSAAFGSPYFLTLATGEGMLYTWSEYETWMRQAGFADVGRQVLPRDHGIIRGVKP
jgi:predicted O-methyltransferase YrrM